MTTTKKTTTRKPRSTAKKTAKPKVISTAIPELPANPFAFEVLDAASKQRSNAKKVQVLQRYIHPSIKTLFIWNFDPTVISVLPHGEVPYGNVSEQGSMNSTLGQKINDAVGMMEELGSKSL